MSHSMSLGILSQEMVKGFTTWKILEVSPIRCMPTAPISTLHMIRLGSSGQRTVFLIVPSYSLSLKLFKVEVDRSWENSPLSRAGDFVGFRQNFRWEAKPSWSHSGPPGVFFDMYPPVFQHPPEMEVVTGKLSTNWEFVHFHGWLPHNARHYGHNHPS